MTLSANRRLYPALGDTVLTPHDVEAVAETVTAAGTAYVRLPGGRLEKYRASCLRVVRVACGQEVEAMG